MSNPDILVILKQIYKVAIEKNDINLVIRYLEEYIERYEGIEHD